VIPDREADKDRRDADRERQGRDVTFSTPRSPSAKSAKGRRGLSVFLIRSRNGD
jgi:hypothetical protein